MSRENERRQAKPGIIGFIVTIIAVSLFYMLMEWLFMVTKSSFMEILPLVRKLEVLTFSVSLLGGLMLLLSLPALALYGWSARRLPTAGALWLRLLYLAPGGVIGAALFLWLDNFTYTVFGFGIVSSAGIWRAVYALVFLLLVGMGYSIAASIGQAFGRLARRFKLIAVIPAALVLVMCVAVAVPLLANSAPHEVMAATSAQGDQLPNIIFITADGVNATHMSVYGYERDTTPNLRAIAGSALVAENNFSNSGKTTGSVISTYTGKYPSRTRVMHPPNILRGDDSYQHMPGILRSLGYRTVQITYPHYVDAPTLNLLNGFDVANGRVADSEVRQTLSEYLPHDFAYFLYETSNRIVDRVRHVFFIKQMVNPYTALAASSQGFTDSERMSQLMGELEGRTQPLFVHVHFMGTHGERFYPTIRLFSEGLDVEAQEGWDIDFYDDSILEFDQYVSDIFSWLEGTGELDHSLLVISSDHGQQFTTSDRIPLIFRFPKGEYAGRIEVNTQNLDIAPTIFDYLGIPVPDWMDGDSLLQPDLTQRPILGFNASKIAGDYLEEEKIGPPFYQFSEISAVVCNRWNALDLETFELQTKDVIGHSASCSADEAPDQKAVVEFLIAHLTENGFDTAELQAALSPQDGLQ